MEIIETSSLTHFIFDVTGSFQAVARKVQQSKLLSDQDQVYIKPKSFIFALKEIFREYFFLSPHFHRLLN